MRKELDVVLCDVCRFGSRFRTDDQTTRLVLKNGADVGPSGKDRKKFFVLLSCFFCWLGSMVHTLDS